MIDTTAPLYRQIIKNITKEKSNVIALQSAQLLTRRFLKENAEDISKATDHPVSYCHGKPSQETIEILAIPSIKHLEDRTLIIHVEVFEVNEENTLLFEHYINYTAFDGQDFNLKKLSDKKSIETLTSLDKLFELYPFVKLPLLFNEYSNEAGANFKANTSGLTFFEYELIKTFIDVITSNEKITLKRNALLLPSEVFALGHAVSFLYEKFSVEQ